MLERESGEYEEPYLKYCSSFPVFGPLYSITSYFISSRHKIFGPPCCDVNNISSRLAFLEVIYPRDGEGPDLAQALGDPADHVVGGLSTVRHRQPVTGHQFQVVLCRKLIIVMNSSVSDILS